MMKCRVISGNPTVGTKVLSPGDEFDVKIPLLDQRIRAEKVEGTDGRTSIVNGVKYAILSDENDKSAARNNLKGAKGAADKATNTPTVVAEEEEDENKEYTLAELGDMNLGMLRSVAESEFDLTEVDGVPIAKATKAAIIKALTP